MSSVTPTLGTALTPEQLRARMLARSRLAAMRKRARRIRRLIAGGAAALFSAVFLAVYVQLASGHDPALTAAAKRSAATSAHATKSSVSKSSSTSSAPSSSTSSTSSSSNTGESSATSSSGESSGSSSGSESSQGTSAVTTSQS